MATREISIYDEIGVPRIINARGSVTIFGGSLMAPEVVRVMDRAAASFVDTFALLDWAGREIARLSRHLRRV